jgi:hypothetical protein
MSKVFVFDIVKEILDPEKNSSRIRIPGVKKAPDPGCGTMSGAI